jgi:uncharacterized membrane protein SirB2
MIEFYPQIKAVHVAMVLASGGLFLLRGLLAWNGPRQGSVHSLLRFASWSVDTTLLTAAMMLLTFLPHAMFSNGWLAVKLLLLPAYVVLGALALRSTRSDARRRLCLVAAVLVYGFMLGVARAHQPAGWFALLR